MTRDDASLQTLLTHLLEDGENEVVEFKEANDNFSMSDIGKYFSAIANEVNLQGGDAGWLVFGVNDKARAVVGTTYREDQHRLMALKQQIHLYRTRREAPFPQPPIHPVNPVHPVRKMRLLQIKSRLPAG